MIGPEDLRSLDILAHPIRELGDVSGGDEDVGKGHDGGVEFEHVLLDDKVLPPLGENVGLKRRSRRSVVVQSSDTWKIEEEERSSQRRTDEERKGGPRS